MKRTAIQKAITPRNWHFGRLSGVRNNLRGILKTCTLTTFERDTLNKCSDLIKRVVDRKDISSKLIKMNIKKEELKQ